MSIDWFKMNVAASVKSSNGSATAFTVAYNSQYFCVMPRHALYKDDKSGFICDSCEIHQPCGDIREDSFNIFTISLKDCEHKVHASQDICIIKLFDRFVNEEEGDDDTEEVEEKENDSMEAEKEHDGEEFEEKAMVTCAPGVDIVSQEGLSNIVDLDTATALSDIEIGTEVYIVGYPTSIGLKHSPQFDYSKPLLKQGIVSNVYLKQQTLIIDAAVYQGNSGSPVLQKDGNIFLGMIIQAIPYVQKWYNINDKITNSEYHTSNYSLAISGEAIMEVLAMFPDPPPLASELA